jgi:hypothetical protein
LSEERNKDLQAVSPDMMLPMRNNIDGTTPAGTIVAGLTKAWRDFHPYHRHLRFSKDWDNTIHVASHRYHSSLLLS